MPDKELDALLKGASVDTFDPVVALLYHLLMDRVSPAAMEEALGKAEGGFLLGGPAQLSNGLVAYQAVAARDRLKRIEDGK